MKNNKGITLIALVITIIVLLILAGVSIAMLTGNNGILTQASTAQKNTDKQNAIEKINVALQAIKTQVVAEQTANTAYQPTATANLAALKEADVTGISTTDTGYEVNSEGSKITITYTNTSTGTSVSGSIDLSKANGGEITKAH